MEDTNILKTSKNVYSYNDLNELLTSIVKLKAWYVLNQFLFQ